MSTGVKAARTWDSWEGQVVDGKFPLMRFLGGNERGAVFLTERPQGEPKTAAIKLVSTVDISDQLQLARWKSAVTLSHPHLIRLFEMGRADLNGMSCVYVLMEYAEEDLSQVARPLTEKEAVDMLRGTLKALAYVQCKGLAHGRLQPSNIMAVSDQLKISSDTIRPNGEWSKALDVQRPCDPPELVKDGASAAGDVWSLGVTLVEVMTKRLPSWETSAAAASLPDGLPKTFRASVLNCLRRDPQQRWTVASFAKSLDPDVDLPKPQPTFTITAERRTTKRRYPLLAGAIALTIAGAAMVPRLINDRPKPQPDVVPRQLPAEVVPPKSVAPEPSKQAGVPEIVKQVLPDVPAKARSTIRGRVTVDVVVAVDGTGSVANAKSVSKQTSRYFTDLALRAARDWKFAPANTGRSRTWTLRFRFLPDAQRPVTVQATPVP